MGLPYRMSTNTEARYVVAEPLVKKCVSSQFTSRDVPGSRPGTWCNGYESGSLDTDRLRPIGTGVKRGR